MHGFWDLLWLGGLILVALVVASVITTFSNRDRIEILERAARAHRKRIDELEQKAGTVSPVPERKTQVAFTQTITPIESYEELADTGVLFSWIRENWLLAIGGVFMVLAAGWLVRYSILHSIIGPAGRVIIGLALGTGIIGIAVRRIKTHINQGSIFAVLGATIVLLTVFAGQKYYELFTPATSTGLMFMTVALIAFISVRYQVMRLSYAGLITAGLIPIMVSTGSKDFVGLFSYLAVVTAGTLWIVTQTGWRKNILIALSMVFAYSIPVLAYHSLWFENAWVGLAFAFGFGLVFFATSLMANLKAVGQESRSDLATAGLLSIYLIAWILNVAPEEWQSLLFVAWTLLFSAASYRLFLETKSPSFFYIYGGVSTMLLVAATATEFSGPALTLAFIAEGGILPWLVWRALKDVRYAVKASFFMVLPFYLSLESFESWRWRGEATLFHENFFVTLAITLVSFAVAWLLLQLKKKTAEPVAGMKAAMILALFFGTLSGGFLVWRTLHHILSYEDVAKTISLTIFMLVGLGGYIKGYRQKLRAFKIYGGIIIGWVSFRLIFIDMPDMEVGGKVVTFFVLGALLLGTAFIERKGKKAIS